MDKETLLQEIKTALKSESESLYRPYTPTNARGYGCSVGGCPNKAYAKGLCNAHYIRKRNGKSLDAPLRHTGTRGGRTPTCRECDQPADSKGGWSLCKGHYRKRRKDIIRSRCVEALGGKCGRCGGEFPHHVYDFHHRADDKDFAVSNMFTAQGLKAIVDEIAKCDLLCANCHRIEHWGE